MPSDAVEDKGKVHENAYQGKIGKPHRKGLLVGMSDHRTISNK
jgi:hypothetical protein